MESASLTTAAGGGGGAGPAPFLLKTYEMVDDLSTDEIVSWSSNNSSFVVWNPPEFARLLLPTYFKHNNFSSFIRQLNTYGFRKIDPEKWEFANDEFVKDQKHLLKNIHRRKPIHSHSNPPAGSVVDQERALLDEELEKLKGEKAALEAQVLHVKQQCPPAVLDFEDLMQRVESIQQRQDKLLAILEKAVQDPSFVDYAAQKFESLDFSIYNKKRRLPQIDQSKPVAEDSFVENHSSCRPESGNVIHQDFSDKLKLELSPAVSDINLVSHSTQSSNEDEGSPQRKLSEGVSKDVETRTSCLPCAPETLELSDTGTSYTFKVDPVLQRKLPANESPGLHLLQLNLTSNEDVDAHTSCHLNLTLASAPLQLNRSPYSARTPQLGQEIGKTLESRFNVNSKESDLGVVPKNRNLVDGDATMTSLHEAPNCKEGPAAPPVRVNDVFWEQFLTERPGSTDNEEASSHYRANPYEEQQDKRSNRGMRRNTKSMEHLSL